MEKEVVRFQIWPLVEWQPIAEVSYDQMPVLRHPVNGELAYDDGSHCRPLPQHIEQAIRSGVRGQLV